MSPDRERSFMRGLMLKSMVALAVFALLFAGVLWGGATAIQRSVQ